MLVCFFVTGALPLFFCRAASPRSSKTSDLPKAPPLFFVELRLLASRAFRLSVKRQKKRLFTESLQRLSKLPSRLRFFPYKKVFWTLWKKELFFSFNIFTCLSAMFTFISWQCLMLNASLSAPIIG